MNHILTVFPVLAIWNAQQSSSASSSRSEAQLSSDLDSQKRITAQGEI